jgi:hypothetical protein
MIEKRKLELLERDEDDDFFFHLFHGGGNVVYD